MPETSPPATPSDDSAADAASNPADIRLAAMNLLARREHSRRELRGKLTRRFPDHAMVDEQLLRLAGENLQSDERFAQSYTRQRTSRGYGPLRLQEELRERGVSQVDIDSALAEPEIDWSGLAMAVMRKKFGDLPARDFKEAARRARFMQYRGFAVEHYQQRERD